MKAVIAGAGIGGLTAALCLLQQGADVTLYEQASALEDVGAGLQLSPNGCKVMRALGLLADIEAEAVRPERIEMRFGQSGAMIFTIPLADEAVLRWGAPYLHIHRADLVTVLRNALTRQSSDALRLGRAVTAYAQDEAGLTIALSDGSRIAAEMLIGADGIRSGIRTQMLGEEAPRFTGCMAWRAVVPMQQLGAMAPPRTACVWVGEGKHAVTYHLRRGALANFVGVVERADWRQESWTEEGTREEALRDFDGWHPVIRTLIKEAPRLFRWALFDRDTLPRWTDGRVALLGDACHPMLPFMAQGAVMAIEDAWVLAQSVRQNANAAEGLHAYERARKTRTSAVQAAARANAGIFHRRTVLGKLATYGPMWLGARLAPAMVHARQDWLYGIDVVTSAARG